MNKREVGRKYELMAKNYLIDNSYKVLETNFSCKIGEIDIIAKDHEYLCFVEVKYRDANSVAKGLYAVNKHKQNKIYKTAQVYLLANNLSMDTACRFDVVSIDGEDITLIKNAF